MSILPKIEYPELIFGFVCPIGTEIAPVISEFRTNLERLKYRVIEIKVTDIFQVLKNYIKPEIDLVRHPEYERFDSYIKYGNQLRKKFQDDSILAATAISRIVRCRIRLNDQPEAAFQRTAFLLHQFKRKEEIDLLHTVYGDIFFQVSLYSRRGVRVDYLSRKFARSQNSSIHNDFRHSAEKIIQEDENQKGNEHGQQVAKIFHDADFIINIDSHVGIKDQITRFCELIFSNNSISPTKMEYGLFLSKAASIRTLDLSRQVGAAIFSPTGEIVALGSNEVPKAGGGTYWCDSPFDDREYRRGIDSNEYKKREVLSELISSISPHLDQKEVLSKQDVRDSRFMDAIEYGRIVHAEMSAIMDAARNGISTRDSTLYCTTFPCHICARHIVASGVKNVIFLEPYPKSLAADLHSDSIVVEGADRGKYQSFPAVKFEHFFGVCPKRYLDFFRRGKRKNEDGVFETYKSGRAVPIVNVRTPYYTHAEAFVLETYDRMAKEFGCPDDDEAP